MIFDHFNIDVPTELMADTKAFYETVFDLTSGFRPTLSRDGYWLYHEDNAILHIFETKQLLPENSKSYLDHIAFRLTNIHAFVARLAQYDISYRTIVNKETEVTQLFIFDPVGVKIECIFQNEYLYT